MRPVRSATQKDSSAGAVRGVGQKCCMCPLWNDVRIVAMDAVAPPDGMFPMVTI